MQYGIEVKLNDQWDQDDIESILENTGVAIINRDHQRTLVRSCHIVTIEGRTFVFHFKEVFGVCGREAILKDHDIARRDAIVRYLESLGCFEVIDELPSSCDDMAFVGFTIVGGDDDTWKLKSKLRFINQEYLKWTIESIRPKAETTITC